MSTILVTGARGNIGSRVVDKLTKSGARVRVLLRQTTAVPDRPSVEVVQGSYDDPAEADFMTARRVGHPLRRELEGLWSARRGVYRVDYEIDDGAAEEA